MKRSFTIGQILSVATPKLMCEIGGVYEILNFLHADSLYTHQLPRACEDAKPWLMESLPWLAGVTCDEVNPDNVRERIAHYEATFGAQHELAPIPGNELLHRNPLSELVEKMESLKGDAA